MEYDKKTLYRKANFFHKHSSVIDSNLTGIRLEADMTETNVNKAVKVSRQSGEGVVFWTCPTQI